MSCIQSSVFLTLKCNAGEYEDDDEGDGSDDNGVGDQGDVVGEDDDDHTYSKHMDVWIRMYLEHMLDQVEQIPHRNIIY